MEHAAAYTLLVLFKWDKSIYLDFTVYKKEKNKKTKATQCPCIPAEDIKDIL